MSLKTICLVRFLQSLEIARDCRNFTCRVIYLKETYLHLWLATLKDLNDADLSRNNFSGIIPKDLQKASILLHLNISFNNLVGEVPTE